MRPKDIHHIVEECVDAISKDSGRTRSVVTKALNQVCNCAERKLKTAIDERIRYERLISEITREALKRNSSLDLTSYIVKRLGEMVDASRVYFFSYDRQHDTVSNVVEWIASGVTSFRTQEQDMPAGQFPFWKKQLLAGQPVRIDDAAHAPEDFSAEMMRVQETKSILVLPVFVFNRPYGFLGFDECRSPRKWKAEDVDMLGAVCRVLAQSIEKERWEEEIIGVERMAAMGRLAGAVAHEINNPLQGMMLHLDLLRDCLEGNEKAERSFHHLVEGVRRISEIVARVLQLHRENMDEEVFDINEVIRSALMFVERRLEHVGCTVDLQLGKDMPPVKGVRQLTHLAILNIITNAMENMSTGGLLSVESNRDGEMAVALISDTGRGICADDLPHIFEPFYSVESGAHPGLGLYIAHAVVTSQGGRVMATSEQGKGTTIKLSFKIS